MDAGIIKKRIRTIRYQLRKKRIKSLLVTNPANVTYATGFLGDDSSALITDRDVFLLTDSRYTEQAKNECPACSIIERDKPMVEALVELAKKRKLARTITVEKYVSFAVFEKLKAKIGGRVRTVAGIVEELRSSKDGSEIASIKKAAQIAAEALRKTLKYVRTNVTENELAGALDFEIRKAGAKNSFETIVAFGPNASRPHHQPTSKKLKKNDTVLIDFGVKFKGYCCDITRCFIVGRPNPFYKKVFTAVREAQSAAIKMIKPGVQAKKVDAAAREVVRRSGLPVYGHGTGHGLGLEIHEQPSISPNSKAKLQPGMVFTIEPAVYIPRKLGVRIEDDVLVTKTGCRILTKTAGNSGSFNL
ncbi:MAG: Xaa-Pro peptidase family protein [Phycisphaerae bacterium]|nr:Xaa-Pro peptidase family protein [Phycisphaerae bacterium]MDD5380690.1 Xaa-Pro peptidase family protein [Phycisphaerae bacterium]